MTDGLVHCVEKSGWYPTITNTQVLLPWLLSTNSLKASQSRSDEYPGLDTSPRMKLWKPVSNLAVSNDTLAMNTTNFLCCFSSIFVILKRLLHNVLNMHFCNILTSDPAIDQGTGASGRIHQNIALTVDRLNWAQMRCSQEAGGHQTMI